MLIVALVEFIVIHNGIITNYRDLRALLEKKGFTFESETDTETIAKLMKHIYSSNTKLSFRELVEIVVQQLVRSTWLYASLLKQRFA